MSLCVLAQVPTLFEQVIFGGKPSFWVGLIYQIAIVLAIFVPIVSLIGMLFIWWERKVAGHIQSRLGPNRVGPIGLFQSVADGLKLILKEDLIPGNADRLLFRLAPYITFAPVFAAFVAMPFGPDMVFEPALAVGLFWILALMSVEVMGVILAGWASNNKWSVYGAMREACQMVSYEIPLGISIIVGVMAVGTLNLVDVGHMQQGGIHTWTIFRNPFVFLAFFNYFVASLASNKRAPFDLPESESELVAGFHTEYSGMRFAFFFFAEYAAMFIVAGIQTALFLGGWNDPFGLVGYYWQRFQESGDTTGLVIVNLIAAVIFTIKAVTIVYVQMWIRWTLPRPRIDQVLHACIKVLLPLSFVLLLGAAVWQLLVPENPLLPWRDYNPWRWGDWVGAGAVGAVVTHAVLALVGVGLFGATVGWVLYAAISGRRGIKRLTDPAPIEDKPEVAAT